MSASGLQECVESGVRRLLAGLARPEAEAARWVDFLVAELPSPLRNRIFDHAVSCLLYHAEDEITPARVVWEYEFQLDGFEPENQLTFWGHRKRLDRELTDLGTVWDARLEHLRKVYEATDSHQCRRAAASLIRENVSARSKRDAVRMKR